jgi:hypothetical protein
MTSCSMLCRRVSVTKAHGSESTANTPTADQVASVHVHTKTKESAAAEVPLSMMARLAGFLVL